MTVTVRLFARLKDLVGTGELLRTLPPDASVADAWDALARDYPALASFGRSISCAVNADYAPRSAILRDGDDVAFLPPVSGG